MKHLYGVFIQAALYLSDSVLTSKLYYISQYFKTQAVYKILKDGWWISVWFYLSEWIKLSPRHQPDLPKDIDQGLLPLHSRIMYIFDR